MQSMYLYLYIHTYIYTPSVFLLTLTPLFLFLQFRAQKALTHFVSFERSEPRCVIRYTDTPPVLLLTLTPGYFPGEPSCVVLFLSCRV